MKKLLFLGGLMAPLSVFAHVKWFVDTSESANVPYETGFYSVTSMEVFVWLVLCFVAVEVFTFLDKKVTVSEKFLAFGQRNEKVINRISQGIMGFFLVTITVLWKVVLIPDHPIANEYDFVLSYFQILFGLMLIFNFKPKYASLGLGVMTVSLVFLSGVVALLENTILLSLAIYFYAYNSKDLTGWVSKHKLNIVRVGTGVSLIVLAFTEKLLYPQLSLQFLATHHWNFMSPILPWFTDKLFVLSTGFAEIIFGLLFIKGVMTRTTTVLIALFFACSVVTMLVYHGAWEVEDLVVYSAAILMLFYGSGKKETK
jgi:uncharacterized membrane protein YphA (DoxX/SURF4 family)